MVALVELYLSEAVRRAAERARTEDSGVVHGFHLEQVLPQLNLDFS